MKSLPVRSVLDVGSGGGVFLLLLPPTWRRVGVDSPSNAQVVRKLGMEGIGLDLEVEALPLENNSFDLVTALEVVEHVANKKHLLSEIYRVLKENGFLVMTTPDARSPFWWLRDHLFDAPGIGKFVFKMRTGRFPDRLDKHKGCLRENELEDLICSQRFSVARRERFRIFQPNDDIVLVGRKRSNQSEVAEKARFAN